MTAAAARARRAGWAAFAITAGAMIATPLLPRGSRARAVLADAVVGGLAASVLAASVSRWGGRRAAAAGAAVAATTLAVERVGTRTGVPFGRYEYTAALQPQVAGVPVAVPAAWFAMALPSRAVAHRLLGARSSMPARAVAGSALLAAWDLFLDPQMVGEGYWQWARSGRYRGIPGANYLGWFVTGLGVMALLEVTTPPDGPPAGAAGADGAPAGSVGADDALTGLYAWMAVMSTLGFAVFFRDPIVALVGGSAMLPPAIAAVVQRHG